MNARTRPSPDGDDPRAEDRNARARARYYRWMLDNYGDQLDPQVAEEESSRRWRRKAALAHLKALTHGPKR
jgi:hypothetical protein